MTDEEIMAKWRTEVRVYRAKRRLADPKVMAKIKKRLEEDARKWQEHTRERIRRDRAAWEKYRHRIIGPIR